MFNVFLHLYQLCIFKTFVNKALLQDEETHNFRYLALQTLTVSGAPNLPEVFGAPRKNYKRYEVEIFTQCSQRLKVLL